MRFWAHTHFVLGLACACLLAAVARAQTVTSLNGNVYSAAFGLDGKIYVGTSFTTSDSQTHQGNVRLNSNGTIDNTFTYNVDSPATSFGFLSGGSFLVNTTSVVTQYSSSGVLNSTFGGGDGSIFAGRALVVDSSGNSFYTGNGQYDSSGNQTVSFGGNSINAIALAVQSDGKILLGGTSGSLTRLNANGTLDSGFTAPSAVTGGTVHGISVQTDGKIVVSGDGFQSGANVLRLNANGTLDNTFSASTTVFGPAYSMTDGTTLISSGANGTNITFDSSGRIVTAGNLIRLSSTGALYSTQPSIVSGFESLSSSGVGVYSLSAVPEPSTYAVLAGLGALAFAWYRRRA